MKIGDLVRFRVVGNNQQLVDEFGNGLCTDICIDENTAEVVWAEKNWATRIISIGYLKVIR